jgi:hypothetical protein
MSWKRKHVETGSDKRHTDISPNTMELGYHNLNKGISPTTKGDAVKQEIEEQRGRFANSNG